MPFYDRRCSQCKLIQVDCWETISAESSYPCPKGCTHGRMERTILPVRSLPNGSTRGVIGDACDVTIKHGLCNPDGTPRRYTSKAEMKREAEKRGLTQHVEHKAANRGSDKSPHTSRWI